MVRHFCPEARRVPERARPETHEQAAAERDEAVVATLAVRRWVQYRNTTDLWSRSARTLRARL
jgi:hypothetical protein